METVNVLKIDTQEAGTSIKDLRNQLKQLKDELAGLEQGSDAFNDVANKAGEVKYQIDSINKAVSGASANFEKTLNNANNISNGIIGGFTAAQGTLQSLGNTVDTSVNAMRKQLKELQTQYAALSEEERKSKVGKQISKQATELADSIKNADQAVGNYKSTIGRYEEALQKAGVGVDGFKSKLTSLLKNPWVAIFTALAAAVMKVIDAFKSSEDRMRELQTAFAPLQAALDVIQQGFDALAKLLSGVVVKALSEVSKAVDWVVKQLDKLGKSFGQDWGLSERLEEAKEHTEAIAKIEQELADKQREFVVEQAKNNAEIAKLRAQAAEKDKYTAKERIKFLEDAIELEKKNLQGRIDIANQELKLAQEKAANTENDKAVNDALAQAEANVINQTTEYNKRVKELNSQLVTAKKEMNTTAKAVDDGTDAIKKQNEQLDIRLEQNKRADISDKERLKNEIEIETERLKLIEEGTLAYEQQLTKIKNLEDKLNAPEQAKEDPIIQKLKDEADAYNESLKTQEQKLAEKRDLVQRYYEQGLIDEQIYQAQLTEIAEKETENQKQILENKLNSSLDFADSFANLFSAVASNMDETNKKQFEAAKAFNIASATISTITGAIDAYMGAQKNPAYQLVPGLAIAMGVIQAATVTAAGIAQIRKIASQTFETAKTGNANVSSGAVSNIIVPPTQYSQTVQGAQTERTIQRQQTNTRVYVLESDIQQTTRKVNVAQSNATF